MPFGLCPKYLWLLATRRTYYLRRGGRQNLRTTESKSRAKIGLTLIRHYFEAAQAMSPTAVGNGTQP